MFACSQLDAGMDCGEAVAHGVVPVSAPGNRHGFTSFMIGFQVNPMPPVLNPNLKERSPTGHWGAHVGRLGMSCSDTEHNVFPPCAGKCGEILRLARDYEEGANRAAHMAQLSRSAAEMSHAILKEVMKRVEKLLTDPALSVQAEQNPWPDHKPLTELLDGRSMMESRGLDMPVEMNSIPPDLLWLSCLEVPMGMIHSSQCRKDARSFL